MADKWNTWEASMDDLIMAGMLYSYEVAVNSIEVQRNGIILLIDVGGFGFSHARQCTYGRVVKMANCIIFGAPIRIRGCSLVRSPYIFEKVYQVIKFAIPEKYRTYVSWILKIILRNSPSNYEKPGWIRNILRNFKI